MITFFSNAWAGIVNLMQTEYTAVWTFLTAHLWIIPVVIVVMVVAAVAGLVTSHK